MAFSTKDARRQKMSAELRDWCAAGAPEDRRTLVLNLSPRADVDQLAARLRDLGAKIVSAGPAVTIANISCRAAHQASKLPGVVRIDLPTRMSPKGIHPVESSDR